MLGEDTQRVLEMKGRTKLSGHSMTFLVTSDQLAPCSGQMYTEAGFRRGLPSLPLSAALSLGSTSHTQSHLSLETPQHLGCPARAFVPGSKRVQPL